MNPSPVNLFTKIISQKIKIIRSHKVLDYKKGENKGQNLPFLCFLLFLLQIPSHPKRLSKQDISKS